MATNLNRVTVNIDDDLHEWLKRDTAGGNLSVASVATAILWEHYHIREEMLREDPRSPGSGVKSEFAGIFALGWGAARGSLANRQGPALSSTRRASESRGRR